MQTAKLFKNGRSQAVRLPKEFRFDGSSESRFASTQPAEPAPVTMKSKESMAGA